MSNDHQLELYKVALNPESEKIQTNICWICMRPILVTAASFNLKCIREKSWTYHQIFTWHAAQLHNQTINCMELSIRIEGTQFVVSDLCS